MLGLLVAILGFFALMMWVDAHNAKDAANRAAASVSGNDGMADMPGMAAGTDAPATWGSWSLRRRRAGERGRPRCCAQPFPADLPAAPAGPIANVNLALTDITVQIAPGVKYSAWAWAGGAPGPRDPRPAGPARQDHAHQQGRDPPLVDFHAARVAPDKAFGDVMPGKSVSYTFRANDAGVFMYHCGTKPVLMHIANGMYGAIGEDNVLHLVVKVG